jgi:hypothetical protein
MQIDTTQKSTKLFNENQQQTAYASYLLSIPEGAEPQWNPLILQNSN